MRVVVGRVVTPPHNQTAVVAVDRLVPHPQYHKRLRRTTRYHVHVTQAVAVGDLVQLVPVRPHSATKHWGVSKVLKQP